MYGSLPLYLLQQWSRECALELVTSTGRGQCSKEALLAMAYQECNEDRLKLFDGALALHWHKCNWMRLRYLYAHLPCVEIHDEQLHAA